MSIHQIQIRSYLLLFVVVVLFCAPRPIESIDADQTRAHCINVFELAFPKQRWTSENDLRAFTANVSTERKSDTFFAFPLGGGPGSELSDFTGGDLLDWFLEMFNPNALQYTEIIMSEVSVVNSVCSMDKLFFAAVGNCHVHAMSRLFIEVDEDGKLVRWYDHYDQEDLNQKMGVCNLQLEEDKEL
mmetsp:Transcript_19059/g.28906  ORF Transcript_19059/g.28906 Transcript_19059/m.28906 type:complete len:186 (+) Transcript_19059:64-621(+)|eukprot:CAMPEP_0196249454 /NCGR_PEP_ID=MMETSP0913-20130531/42950_1 /TAXON_ID=49265 /ORGANISM="Thalassiosira rotula, Strain GSO102" /LENGTH=185 /DNA_ID=CAMNT_0041535053 /DNA_START=61 /DNA_END=618 /DNA_ORIENTATION=-